MKFGAVCLIVVAISLAGCARQPVMSVQAYRMQQMEHWYGQTHWQIDGRLGVVTERDSFSGSINWRHEPGRDLINMAGPLGQGRISLDVTDDQVVVNDGEQVRVYRDSVDQLLLRQWGVDVPVQALRFWMLGLAQPRVDYQESELGFKQHGWRVIFRQLQEVDGSWLPRKISMEKNNNKLKLIVDRWEI